MKVERDEYRGKITLKHTYIYKKRLVLRIEKCVYVVLIPETISFASLITDEAINYFSIDRNVQLTLICK